MDTQQLINILQDHLKSTFLGVFAKDELPVVELRPLAFIVNEDLSQLPGSHWRALYLYQDGRGEFFDSYGRPPDKIVEAYMDKHAPNGWEYNTRHVQSIWSSLCGGYCLQYLEARHRLRDAPMSKLLKELFPFSRQHKNDEIVYRRLRQHYNIEIPIVDPSYYTSLIGAPVEYPK